MNPFLNGISQARLSTSPATSAMGRSEKTPMYGPRTYAQPMNPSATANAVAIAVPQPGTSPLLKM